SRLRTATSPTWSHRTTTTPSSSPRARTSPSGSTRSLARVRSSSGATPRAWARPSCPTPTTGDPSPSWMAPSSSSTTASSPRSPPPDPSLPQPIQAIATAKQLPAAAGHPSGFNVTLDTEVYEEIPQLAQVIKANAAKAGVNINLNIETQSAYYGKATYGNS